MGSISGELARVRAAYEEPTLTLLHQRHAPTVIAVFRSSFGRDVRTIPTARLHDHVDAYLTELSRRGETDLPRGAGRDLCLRWMRDRWLVRSSEADGSEVYALTSHAQEALQLVASLTRDRATLSEHRIATIVAAARRFNTQANPDRGARVELLDAEIARLTRDRDELVDGAEMLGATADYMAEGYGELLALLAGLPSEFARVEEAFVALRGTILASFRAEDRSAGEVIDDYLARVEDLNAATAEGRAFMGALALLRDDDLLSQLREDLASLLTHPMAAEILMDVDRRELLGTVAQIRRGIEAVIEQRTRVTKTLTEYIVTHDLARDRELDSVLRQLDAEISGWMQTAGARATVPLPLLPAEGDVQHLRERFYDADEDTAPPPLSDVSEHHPEQLTLEQLRLQGGPTLARLADELAAAAENGRSITLGDLFADLEPSMRRPVEVLGLLHLATNDPSVTAVDGTDVYPTVRPDGSTRQLAVPRLALNLAASSADQHAATDPSGDNPAEPPLETP
jgi:hypothetical protein